MKAAVVASPGAKPQYKEFPEPVVADGERLVELVAAGIHPVVRALASGAHYGSEGVYPMIPGVDAVARTSDGALVYTGFVKAPYGTLAERMAVPSRFQMELPQGADPIQIAGGVNPGVSSWMPLTVRLEELGDAGLGTVLVLGATGAAG